MKSKKNLKPKSQFDLITLGDSTIDLFLEVPETNEFCSIDRQKCVVTLSYGDKIAVSSFQRSIAGNSTNVAVGGSRLGLNTAFWTVIGHDPAGQEILSGLKAEKVKTKYVQFDPKLGTNTHIVIRYQGERSILVYHQPYKYPVVKLPKTDWLYFSSVGEKFLPQQKTVVSEIDRVKCKLAFNPGTYQLKQGLDALKPLIQRCECLFLNVEESELLLKLNPGAEIKSMMQQWLKLGVKKIYITDGIVGAYASDGQDYLFIPSYGGDRLEPTGAGDSFASAAVAANFHGLNLADSMRWGIINSGHVVKQVGPIAGLQTLTQIKRQTKMAAASLIARHL